LAACAHFVLPWSYGERFTASKRYYSILAHIFSFANELLGSGIMLLSQEHTMHISSHIAQLDGYAVANISHAKSYTVRLLGIIYFTLLQNNLCFKARHPHNI